MNQFLLGVIIGTICMAARAEDAWDAQKIEPSLRATQWIPHTEPSFGLALKLPNWFGSQGSQKKRKPKLVVDREVDYVRINNYEDDEIVGDGGLSPYQYYLTINFHNEASTATFNASCVGTPSRLRKVKGGLWCTLKDLDDGGDSSTTQRALIPTPAGGLIELDLAAGFGERDIATFFNSIQFLKAKQ